MMRNFNEFSMGMKNSILWVIYSSKVVTMYVYGPLLNPIVFHHLFYPQELCLTTFKNNVFNFDSR